MSRSAATDPRGVPFVVSGPSGVGKSTLLRRVLDADPRVRFSVSHTTRPPREGEIDGRHYCFVDEKAFRALANEDGFLEWAEYQGHLYGTSHEAVRGPIERGFDLILEVEVQGAAQLRDHLPEAVFVFVVPPSLESLEERLHGRNTDTDEVVRKRLDRAREELGLALGNGGPRAYDYVIQNEEIDRAVADLQHVIGAARVERDRVAGRYRKLFRLG